MKQLRADPAGRRTSSTTSCSTRPTSSGRASNEVVQDAVRGDRPRVHRRAGLPPELAGGPHPDDRRAGLARRHAGGHVRSRLLDQQPHPLRHGAGHRHRGGRRDRGRRGGRVPHRPRAVAAGRHARRRCPKWRRRSSACRWCCAPCSCRPRSFPGSPASSSSSSRSPSRSARSSRRSTRSRSARRCARCCCAATTRGKDWVDKALHYLLGWWLFRGFNWTFERGTKLYGRAVGLADPARGGRARRVRRAARADVPRVPHRARRVHPAAGSGLPRREPGTAAGRVGRAHRRGDEARWPSICLETDGVAHTVQITGYSIFSGANIPNNGGMYVAAQAVRRAEGAARRRHPRAT